MIDSIYLRSRKTIVFVETWAGGHYLLKPVHLCKGVNYSGNATCLHIVVSIAHTFRCSIAPSFKDAHNLHSFAHAFIDL